MKAPHRVSKGVKDNRSSKGGDGTNAPIGEPKAKRCNHCNKVRLCIRAEHVAGMNQIWLCPDCREEEK